MNLLAIDTSTDYLSLAVTRENRLVGIFHKKTAMNHSRLLVPTIDKILKKARLRIGDVDCFAVSIGPGSFTGLRIGVSVVKGLAFSLNKPVVGIPTLDAIARNAADYNGVICPVLDARKNKVYACLYRSNGKKITRISRYLLMHIEDLRQRVKRYDKILFIGDMTETGKSWHPKAEIVARLGYEMYKKNKSIDAEELEPMYIYSKECDIKGI